MSDDINNNKITKCFACDGTVSKTAKICPHCGQKKPATGGKAHVPKWVAYFLIGCVILTGINIISTGPTTSTASLSSSANTEEARKLCEKAIKLKLNNPSTLDLHRVSGYAANTDAKGTIRITQTFSAQNSFGLRTKYDAYCSMTANGDFNIDIAEQ